MKISLFGINDIREHINKMKFTVTAGRTQTLSEKNDVRDWRAEWSIRYRGANWSCCQVRWRFKFLTNHDISYD